MTIILIAHNKFVRLKYNGIPKYRNILKIVKSLVFFEM